MKKFIFLLILFFPSFGYSAGTAEGKVDYIIVRSSDGLIYFALKDYVVNGQPAGKPACAAFAYWIIKDENSNSGKQQLSLLLSAHASGKNVKIYGTGECVRWRDGEDVGAIRISSTM